MGQREIKFRAWDYFNNVMIYDSDDETDFKFYNGKSLVKYVTEQHTVENGIDIDRPIWNQVDGPVMQYTGLKDKNGKEIYEGDIVNYPFKNFNGKIIFLHGGFCIETNAVCRYDLDNSASTSLEVKGNVFENPELLEMLR